MGLFFVCRVLFYLFNSTRFGTASGLDFVAGMWFDAIATCLVMLPLVLFELFPNQQRGKVSYQKFLALLTQIVLAIGLVINLADIEYFKHTSARSTSSVLRMLSSSNDFLQQLPSFFRDFWFLFVFLILMLIVSNWLFKRINRIKEDSLSTHGVLQIGWFILVTVGFVFTIRGGFGLRPITATKAASVTSSANVQLVLNSAFTVLNTIGINEVEEKNDFSEEKLKQLFDPVKRYDGDTRLQDPNVVILILESFSAEFVTALGGAQSGYTPFLDSLIEQSLLFTHCYANSKKSMDALPAVVASIPKLMNMEYLMSLYSANQIESLPKLLKTKGYSSGFYHGATNGSMNFDVFAELAGFDRYYGRSEYNNEADFDGTWGIFDAPFLRQCALGFNDLKPPFLSTIFTISSHPPYTIPSELLNRFGQSPHPQLNAYAYSDYALGQFFETAQKQDWYANTLFVLVADHTPYSPHAVYQQSIGNMHVPLVFYDPSGTLKAGRNSKIVGQVDIMPSILDLIGYSDPFFAFGQSVFQPTAGYSSSYVGSEYLYFGAYKNKNYLLKYTDETHYSVFDLSDSLLKTDLSTDKGLSNHLQESLKAQIQTHNNALRTNKMRVETAD